MADLPILFSAPMVRAILREIEQTGTGKTQTRRVIKPYEFTLHPFKGNKPAPETLIQVRVPARLGGFVAGPCFNPRIAVGDRLYVREHWRTTNVLDAIPPRELKTSENETIDYTPVHYEADGNRKDYHPHSDPPFGKHRQAMHMPRWASRITLIVQGVKVERLQDISEADAVAEGIEDVTREVAPSDPRRRFWKRYRDGGWNGYVDTAVGSYASLWTEINGPGAWEANPWVAAYTFRPILGNIDQVEG